MRGRIARATLALLAGALIFGPSTAQAGNQLFEGSWTVKAFGNERTGGAGESALYSAYGIPQGIQCNPNQPRCPFDSTPTDGAGNFAPLGGSLMAPYCANLATYGSGPTARPSKGGTPTTGMGGAIPPLYRNPGFFTPSGQPRITSCNRYSRSPTTVVWPAGGKGLVQAGQPITGMWTATTTGTPKGAFGFLAAPATGGSGIRTTGLIGEFNGDFPYLYSYTYATLRNDVGTFGPGKGPGNFNIQFYSVGGTFPVASINVTQGAAKFGGTMRMLGALTTKVCYHYAGGCALARNNWRYDAVGAPAHTMGGVVTDGYAVSYKAYYFHTSIKATSTVRAVGSRFPWTTGSVTVTATGRGPHKTVHYAHGYDNRVATMGTGGTNVTGTIQLVTPVLTRWISQFCCTWETGGIGILRIKFVSSTPPATNDLILQPASASTDMGTFSGSISNVIDQSGLSAGYTSQVANFDTYIASAPSHDSLLTAAVWLSSFGTTTGNVDFDLGGTFFIQSVALWNRGEGSSDNITGITLLADDNASFTDPVTLGSFTADLNTGPIQRVLPEVFTFAPAAASHVRMQITSNNGASTSGFGEIAFEVLADLDNDGIPDVFETNTGTFVSPTDTGSDPSNPDSDGDGLGDGEEVAIGTDPNDEDSDGDLVCDGGMQVGECDASGPDNCPFVANPSQANSDALLAGDACQCGDLSNEGGITELDLEIARKYVVGGTPPVLPVLSRCNVIGPSDGGVSDCDIADVFILQRFLAGSPVTVENTCGAYLGP
ncbi:MAG: hypothetical protein IH974_09550 [Myxococcales bacterium]|nr:hypothetical protein [Myxococcales bacterium]